MHIWSAEIKELETLYNYVKGRFSGLEMDLGHLIKTDDENVVLLYARRCLEIIVTDLCEAELKRPHKTVKENGINESKEPAEAGDVIKKSKKKLIFLLSGIFLIIAVVVVVLVKLDVIGNKEQVEVNTELEKSIAVLPFENMSDDEEYVWFGDAMTDEIIMQLYKIKQFVVRSRTSVMQYKGTLKTIPVIGQELKVNYLIEGSAQRFEDRVRIRVQLINAKTDNHLWGDTFKGEWKDVLSLQSKIAEQIAIRLKTLLTPEEVANIQERPTENLEAYDLYLLGMHYYNNYSHDSDFWKSIDYFQQAIDIDTTFALAYAGLADTYYLLRYFNLLPPNEIFAKVKENATKALELNENLANAHCSIGDVKLWYEYDLGGAEKEYVRAIEINPNSSSAHIAYAYYLLIKGKNDEAILHADYSLELDPLSKLTKMRELRILFYSGFPEEALQQAENDRDSDPTWFNWYWQCATFYTELGMYNKAVTMLETQISLMGNDNISDELSLLGYVYGRSGQKDKAQAQLDMLNKLSSGGIYISNTCFRRVYIGLENFKKAIEYFEKSYYDHSIDLIRLKAGSLYDPIRNDPRFIDIIKKVGL
jgi:adenylate cyclase